MWLRIENGDDYNSNGENTPNIDWKFWLRNGGLNYLRTYIH